MLTPDQIAERRKGIGASDAAKIVAGEWHKLWLEKTGRAESEDLSGVWAVQLGSHTENLNLDWYARRGDCEVIYRGKVFVSEAVPFMRCTLDGATVEGIIIEAKHVNGYSKIEEVTARYTPQVQHQLFCSGCTTGVLSVIIGAAEPTLVTIDRDDFWLAEYVGMAKEFWGFVERDEEPTKGKVMEIAPIAADKMREVDMTGNNAWASAAADFISFEANAKLFEMAKKDLKNMIEPDVGKATGHGLIASRSKAGAISFKKEK